MSSFQSRRAGSQAARVSPTLDGDGGEARQFCSPKLPRCLVVVLNLHCRAHASRQPLPPISPPPPPLSTPPPPLPPFRSPSPPSPNQHAPRAIGSSTCGPGGLVRMRAHANVGTPLTRSVLHRDIHLRPQWANSHAGPRPCTPITMTVPRSESPPNDPTGPVRMRAQTNFGTPFTRIVPPEELHLRPQWASSYAGPHPFQHTIAHPSHGSCPIGRSTVRMRARVQSSTPLTQIVLHRANGPSGWGFACGIMRASSNVGKPSHANRTS